MVGAVINALVRQIIMTMAVVGGVAMLLGMGVGYILAR